MGADIDLGQRQREVFERIRTRSIEVAERRIQRTRANGPRIAVTRPGCDDMGAVLAALDYKYALVGDIEVSDSSVLVGYDVLFINCGAGGNPAANKVALQRFVQRGGILYVSDLSFPQIEAAFPNFIESSSGGCAGQWVNAKVVKQELKDILGSHVRIYFDLGAWIPIERARSDVHVYLTGSFNTSHGHKEDKPILVSFKYGLGEVIFTSFHNHRQATDMEQKLLRFFILKTVSAACGMSVVALAQSKGLLLTSFR